ncbi:MAG: hypothetical protein ACLURV_08890 [Gallintestinimicrobium sp.]
MRSKTAPQWTIFTPSTFRICCRVASSKGVEQLSKSWRSQGGEEILEAVNAEYQKTKAKQ